MMQLFARESRDRATQTELDPWQDRAFLRVSVIFLAFSILLMLRSPTVWMDEVQIVDYARTQFNATTDWSVSCHADGTPKYSLSAVGSAYLQLFFIPFGISLRVVRSVAILNGILLGWSFYFLLRAMNLAPRWAAWLGLALVADRVFNQSVRGARLDSIACGATLVAGGFWLRSLRERCHANRRAVWAGIFAGLAPFIWATSVIGLTSIFVLSMLFQSEERAKVPRLLAFVVFGGMLAGVLVLGLLALTPEGIGGFFKVLDSASSGKQFGFTPKEWKDLFNYTFTSPAFWILACLGLYVVAQRRWRVGLAVLPLVAAFLATLALPPFYVHRYVYAMPWLYVAIVVGSRGAGWNPALWTRWLAISMVLISIVGRSVTTFFTWSARDYDAYAAELGPAIPAGEVVWATDHQPYYVALERGWRFHTAVFSGPDATTAAHCNYFITPLNQLPNWIKNEGVEVIRIVDQTRSFRGGKQGYGSAIYRRKANTER